MRSIIYPVTTETQSETRGAFQAELTDITTNLPISNATVSISTLNEPERVIEQIQTDSSGFTPFIYLPAPPVELSLTATNDLRPYS